MKNSSGYFEGREAKKIFYQCWLPDSGDVKAYIIAIHDLGAHSNRIKEPAEYFTQKGYAVYSFDLRGHWRTGEKPGHIDSMDHIQKDIILFTDIVRKDLGDKKLFLIGHSFGGLISLIYGMNHPGLPGLIAASPMLGQMLELPISEKVVKKMAGPIGKISPLTTVKFEVDQKHLTRDLKVLKEYLTDDNKLELISVKTASEIDKSMKWAIKNASKLRCPSLILQAGNDKIVDKEKTKRFFENILSTDKTYKEYNGFLHDLWNEKGREQVFQDMYIWLEKHLK